MKYAVNANQIILFKVYDFHIKEFRKRSWKKYKVKFALIQFKEA